MYEQIERMEEHEVGPYVPRPTRSVTETMIRSIGGYQSIFDERQEVGMLEERGGLMHMGGVDVPGRIQIACIMGAIASPGTRFNWFNEAARSAGHIPGFPKHLDVFCEGS